MYERLQCVYIAQSNLLAHVVTKGPALNVLGRTWPENENTAYSALHASKYDLT